MLHLRSSYGFIYIVLAAVVTRNTCMFSEKRHSSSIMYQLLLTRFFNQVFRKKTLVIENDGCRRAGVHNSFPEHNSAIFRNILMIHGRIIERVNMECHTQE